MLPEFLRSNNSIFGQKIASTLLACLLATLAVTLLFSTGVTAQSSPSIQLSEPSSSTSSNTTTTQSQVPQIKPSQTLTFDNGNNYKLVIHDEDKGGTITTTPSINVTTGNTIALQNPLYPGVNTPNSYKGTFWIFGVTSGPVDAPVSSSGSVTAQGITNLSVSLVDEPTGNVIDRTNVQPYIIGYHKDGKQNSTSGQIEISVNQSVLPDKTNLNATIYDSTVDFPKDTSDKLTIPLTRDSSTNSFTGVFNSSSVAGGKYSVKYNGSLPQPYNTKIDKYFNNDITVTNGPGDVTGNGKAAKDPDGDGAYEDVNGNGQVDLLDVQVLFSSLNQFQGNLAFDINGDSSVDLLDVQTLFSNT